MKLALSHCLSRATLLLICLTLVFTLPLTAQDVDEKLIPSSPELKTIRLELEKQAEQSPGKFKHLGDELLEHSKENPTDLLSQFKWAVFVDESAKNSTLDKNIDMMDVNFTLSRPKQPWPLEYQRIKFIISSMAGPNEEHVSTGRRLSEEYPTDPEVLYHFGRSLSIIRSPEESAEQFRVAKRLLELAPNKSSSHYLLAVYWYDVWSMQETGSQKNREYGQKFIDAAKVYLKLAPKEGERVDLVKRMIEGVKEDIK